jgi:hypothetical protein
MKQTDSENDKKRNKVIALITTVIVHGLLLVCFIFMGLTHQVPPPPEYGIEVEMGGGGGGGSKSQTSNHISSSSAPSENISTQNIEATTTVNATPKPVVKPTRPQSTSTENQQTVEETPTVNQNALFRRNTSQGGEGGGSGGGVGTGYGTGTGSGTGSGSGSGNGGGHGSGMGDGTGFFLNGRPVMVKEYPKAKNNLEGVVKVDFRADRDGNVVYAKAGGKGTTINDLQIWEECEKAAKRSKFKAKADAQMEEKGVITYIFKLQ